MNDFTYVKRLAWLATAVLLLSLFGYGGYVLYPRFDLNSAAASGLLPLAVMAGVAPLFPPAPSRTGSSSRCGPACSQSNEADNLLQAPIIKAELEAAFQRVFKVEK